MMNVGVDHVNKLLAMTRQFAAQGGGLVAGNYGAPYPGGNVTIVSAPTEQQQASPSKPGLPGILKSVAAVALMSTGAGALGVGGYYAIDKALSSLPARVAAPTVPAKPMEFDIKWRNDPDKGGMQFDEVKPK